MAAVAFKLTDILKDAGSGGGVASRARDDDRRFGGAARGGRDERKADYRDFENTYYDLVTGFFEYGWGQSFHFAPRAEGESFAASIARHEHDIAHRLGLGPGMVAADIGCGVGGPLIEIARFTGARIVGVDNNAMQFVRRAPADPRDAVAAGAAARRAARDDPGLRPAEPRRRLHRRSRPARHFQPDILRPRPETGVTARQLSPQKARSSAMSSGWNRAAAMRPSRTS